MAQKTFASDKTSAINGSLPDGNAPSCLDMTYVCFPAGIGPVVVVAQPVIKNKRMKRIVKLYLFISCSFSRLTVVMSGLEQILKTHIRSWESTAVIWEDMYSCTQHKLPGTLLVFLSWIQFGFLEKHTKSNFASTASRKLAHIYLHQCRKCYKRSPKERWKARMQLKILSSLYSPLTAQGLRTSIYYILLKIQIMITERSGNRQKILLENLCAAPQEER